MACLATGVPSLGGEDLLGSKCIYSYRLQRVDSNCSSIKLNFGAF